MTAPRRLSCVPVPVPGEAFTSWVARSAEFHELTTDQMLDFLRLPFRSPLLRYGVELDPLVLMNLTRTSGLRVKQARAMFLFDGRSGRGESWLSWNWRKAGRRPWLWRPRQSAVCPECVARQPAVWKREWRLLTVVACAEHRLYLHSWCPSCRGPVQIGARPDHLSICAGPPADFLRRRSSQGRWKASAAARRCGARWEELPRYPIRDDRLLDLQRVLTDRLCGPQADGAALTYRRDLHMALRLAIQLGALTMLDTQVDPPVWLAFSLFQPLRDQMAVTAGADAEFQYASLYNNRPGPMLMAAAISIVAALCDSVDHPAPAAQRIIEHYTHRLAKPEFRVLERALVSNDVFGHAVVERVPDLKDLDIGPVMGWRDRLAFNTDEGVSAKFGKIEQLITLGEWAMAMTSLVMVEPLTEPPGSNASASVPRP